MKKIISTVALLFLYVLSNTGTIAAQNESLSATDSLRDEVAAIKRQIEQDKNATKNKQLWGRQKTFKIGMANNTIDMKNRGKLTPNYGFNLGLTKTYFVHKEAIGGFVKIGIDATWFDITYVNYADMVKKVGSWDWDYYTYSDSRYYDEDYDYDYDEEFDFGNHQLDIAMGIGLSATFAPFYHSDNASRYLKGKVYCNFMPSYSMLIQLSGGDTQFSSTFVPYITFGAQVSWKVLSLFVEGRWGSANYKIFNFDDEYGEGSSSEKIGCSNSGVRFGIGLSF